MSKAAIVVTFFVLGSIIASLACQDSQTEFDQPGIQFQEQEKEKSKKILIPANDDKSTERKDFMRIKMQASQLILEGLTVEDFDLVNKGIQQIKDMTKSSKWVSIDDGFYRELVSDFEMATGKLEASSQAKNIDATALRYFQLTTNCIDCHKHIREAEYEF